MTEPEKLKLFLSATEAAAKEAQSAFADAASHGVANYPHWLYYQPAGMAFAIIPEGHLVPEGFSRAADAPIPMTMPSVSHLTAWIREKTQRLDHFPKSAVH